MEEMDDNWYVVWIRDNGNAVMTANVDFEDSYRDYRHFVNMNPENHYVIVSDNDLAKHFELVKR